MIKYRVSFTVHDTELNGNRLDLNIAINVEVEHTGNSRTSRVLAQEAALREFKRMGITQLGEIDVLDDPNMRVSWDITPIDFNA